MMSDGNFVFDSLELAAGNQEIVVTDANALATIRTFSNTTRMLAQTTRDNNAMRAKPDLRVV